MSAVQTAPKRILVYLKHVSRDKNPVLAKFTQCLVDYFDQLELTTLVHGYLQDNCFVLTNEISPHTMPLILKHPSFCPIHCLSPNIDLPNEVIHRGIDVGVAVILESMDNKILLTRRAKHLRTFPGIWVPPGGHVEGQETLTEAGLREFKEETGLEVSPKQCVGEKLNLMAFWESVYPAKLNHGDPKRHHLVTYLHGKLKELNSEAASAQLQIEPNEVDACAWLDRTVISAIVASDEEKSVQIENPLPDLPSYFRAHILSEEQKMVECSLPLAPLLRVASGTCDTGLERVSSGTKFALEQWLKLTK